MWLLNKENKNNNNKVIIIIIIIILILIEEKQKTGPHIIFDRRRWHLTSIAVLAGSNILMTFYIVSFTSNDISFKQSVITKVKEAIKTSGDSERGLKSTCFSMLYLEAEIKLLNIQFE